MTVATLNPRRVIPTPLHSRTLAACQTIDWQTRCGFTVPSVFTRLEDEDKALHESVGMSDISARFQVLLTGKESEVAVNRLVVADVNALRSGATITTPMCDRQGLVMDIADVIRLDQNTFRIHTSQPHLPWLMDTTEGLDATVGELAASPGLSLTGPEAPYALEAVGSGSLVIPAEGGGHLVDLGGDKALITRPPGRALFTVHIWTGQEECQNLWDRLLSVAGSFGVAPVGEKARHILRVEEGRPLLGEDFVSPSQPHHGPGTATAIQLGFGDQITGDKGYFSGGRVLLSQHQKGQEKRLYSLNCAGHDVPSGTQLASKRSDDALGVATSMCYSPTLQAYVGLCKLTQSVAVPMALEARARRLNGRIESGGRVQVWAKNPGLLKKADSNAS